MAENTQQTPETVAEANVEEQKTNLFAKVACKYPRTTRVVAIVGGTTAVLSVLTIANTVKKNRQHLELASEHAKEALHELSTSVSPSPENTEA